MNRKLLKSSLLFFFEFGRGYGDCSLGRGWPAAAAAAVPLSLSLLVVYGCHPTGCHRSSAIKRASWRPHWHPNVNRLYINRRTEWELSLEAVMRRIEENPSKYHTRSDSQNPQDTTDDGVRWGEISCGFQFLDIENESPFMPAPKR